MSECVIIKSKWHCLRQHSLPELQINRRCRIYGKLQDYHYGEMIKRLNEMPGKLYSEDKELERAGYLLRELWHKYEDRLVLHKTKEEGGKSEQDCKNELKRKVDDITKREGSINEETLNSLAYGRGFRFGMDSETAVWGAYTDLVYDTCPKDWTKSYQYTFHELFHNIDYLACTEDKKYFSQTYKNKSFDYCDTEYQFGNIINTDVSSLSRSVNLEGFGNNLPKHDKAPLYDIVGGVLYQGKFPIVSTEQFGHDLSYWSTSGNFYGLLAREAFAHMAAAAVVNSRALKVVKDYLKTTYKMFVKILGEMAGTYKILIAR